MRRALALVVLVAILAGGPAAPARAEGPAAPRQTPQPDAAQQLAERFAPIIMLKQQA
jgi:hypothetical protein